jgi:hypothetical protein
MERLTEKFGSGYCLKHCLEENPCSETSGICLCDECSFPRKAYQKLGEYEDLEEQNKLLKLPCKERGDGEMSNDLISRSVLLEEINSFSMRITGSANAMAITIMEEAKKSIAKIVDEQPTAYNVDKIVEQLEELRQNEIKLLCDHESDTKDMQAMRGHNILQDVIKIVKSGGINEIGERMGGGRNGGDQGGQQS